MDSTCSSSDFKSNDLINHWKEAVAEEVSKIANENMVNNGLIFDAKSGLYFDSTLQCYYNPDIKLYYHIHHKAFYSYDIESNSFKFYSKYDTREEETEPIAEENVDKQAETACTEDQIDVSGILNEHKNNMNQSTSKDDSCNSETINTHPEVEGKLLNSECTLMDMEFRIPLIADQSKEGIRSNETPLVASEILPSLVVNHESKSEDLEISFKNEPCLRAIVTSSSIETVSVGTLFFITWPGGTIGRTESNDIRICDELISRNHALITCYQKHEIFTFEVEDMGSKNGTLLNKNPLLKGKPVEITHGSTLILGNVSLLCHIHPLYESCSECQPLFKNNISFSEQSTLSLIELHSLEHKRLKKKYGLSRHCYRDKIFKHIRDRAQERRTIVGSSHDSEKTEMASIEEPISHKNKGHIMLTKMGWKLGDTLGKLK